MIPRITAVHHVRDYRLDLAFSDGTHGEVDLRDWIVGRGAVFAPLEEIPFFRQVSVNHEAGTIQSPNNVDFCPDVLYSRATGKPIPFAEPDESDIPPQKQSA